MNIFRCPRCGKGRLYVGLLVIADACGECGLPLAGHEEGDGPAVFGILILGALAAVFATIVEIKFEPPFWVHAALWIPFIIVGSVACLRFLKAALVHAQYRLRREDFSQGQDH